MSVEALQMDIDQRGKKLMEFHWPMANCTVLHNQINVLSPSFLHSPLSGGLLMLKLVLVEEPRGGGAPENVDRCVRKCSARLLRIVGKCVWSARLKDGEPRFSAAVVYSSSDFRGNARNREILWCRRSCTDAACASLAPRGILYSRCRRAAFMFCDQGQRLKISD